MIEWGHGGPAPTWLTAEWDGAAPHAHVAHECADVLHTVKRGGEGRGSA